MSPEGWLALVALGVATYATRASFVVPGDRVRLPRVVRRSLRFIPIAVLSAIAAPAIVAAGGSGDLLAAPARVGAAVAAGIVAWRGQVLPLALFVGLITLLVLQLAGFAAE